MKQNVRLSELKSFAGKQLLLRAQQRGLEEWAANGMSPPEAAVDAMIIGLAILLTERGILRDE